MNYTVHSFHPTTVPVEAKTGDGETIIGQQPVAIIELVPEDDTQTTITIRRKLTASTKEAVETLFAEGNVVSLGEFSLVSAAPKEAQ
jgi:hypothetical protein